MFRVNSFDVVSIVIDEASKKFGNDYFVDTERLNLIKGYCEAIDRIMEENESRSIEAEIKESDKSINISFSCDVFSAYSDDNVFCSLVLCSNAIGFYIDEDDQSAIIELNFDGVWGLKHE